MGLKAGRVGIHPSQVDPITGMLINGPTPGSISFEDLSDAQISNPEVGQTLIYNGTGWENEFSSISPTTLAALQDVQISDPEDGALLTYDAASGKWVNSVTPPAPVVPDGSTVTPTDDVEVWLSCAGIDDKSYTTLTDILGDSVTFNALLGDSNANAYLARSTTFATTLCASQYAMNLIGQYDVCCDALLVNSTWASAIGGSTYVDYVMNVKVPKMTSNTTPSGECFAKDVYSGQNIYAAFDGNPSIGCHTSSPGSVVDWYIGYKFTSSVKVYSLAYRISQSNSQAISFTIKLQGTNDGGSTWTDLTEVSTLNIPASTVITGVLPVTKNLDNYDWYRIYTNGKGVTPLELQFYGHASSGEKIHGANEEVAYYLDGATQVPISNPSTLDAGTYTFGSTVAKNPDSLATDYTKSIRITPNTVEVVLRPDNSVYWYGYEGSNLENMLSSNGWSESGTNFNSSPTYNTGDIVCVGNSSSAQGIGNKNVISSAEKIKLIANGVSAVNNSYGRLVVPSAVTSKAFNSPDYYNRDVEITQAQSLHTMSVSDISNFYFGVITDANGRSCKVHALWYE